MVRVKHRYLLLNFLYPTPDTTSTYKETIPELLQFNHPTSDQLNIGLLLKAIRGGVTELFGDYGVGVVNQGLKVNYLSTATSTAIIRCPRAHYQLVWAALTFMTKWPRPIDQPVVVKIVRVSGTIIKVEEEVIRRAKKIIERAKLADGTADAEGPVANIVKAARRRTERDVLVEVDEDRDRDSESDE
ncbi:hypothetical protein K469DRAFT_724808 [Zopfia rhizophila CBS 207.26]|uniref:Ribonuclease P/MRP protein subunit POP5 n=1 Tax=Zopfia rhizophila CBS 207.26 TaxID=1314779 RepID=A0A6A6EEE9_9PEZI|nr:hypothetical protein K469DRAFT_724808 [Zopfia rhizophila CBS 207.26]